MKERREPKDASILAVRVSCAGDGQVHSEKNFCCIDEFYNGLWRSNMVKASRVGQKIEAVGQARSRKTAPRTGSFRPGVMARDSATNKETLNSRRELTKSINPFDAPLRISRNGPGICSGSSCTAMVVDLKTVSIGEVHGGFRAILHSRQTLRTSLQDVQDGRAESAGAGYSLCRGGQQNG